MIVFCQPIFRLSACGDAQAGGISGRITMTHRPQSLDDCAPTLLHHPISMSLRKQGFVEPLFIPSLKPMGFTGYLIRLKKKIGTDG